MVRYWARALLNQVNSASRVLKSSIISMLIQVPSVSIARCTCKGGEFVFWEKSGEICLAPPTPFERTEKHNGVWHPT